MITFYKDGSGIHIKKSHKGKFTEYCGGKVTEECIRRGKNSPDPKIRKQATFAKNARVFKHQGGGSTGPDIQQNQINNIYGGKGPVSDSNYATNFQQTQQTNQENFNSWNKNRIEQQQLEQQQKVEKAQSMGDTIANVVGDMVVNPIANKIQENKIDNTYRDAGLSDEERKAGYQKGLSDRDIILARINADQEAGKQVYDNINQYKFDDNGMLLTSKNPVVQNKQYQFIQSNWIHV